MPSARPTRKAKENAREVALAVANNGKIPRKRLQPIVEQEMVPVIPQNPPSGINQSMAQTISQPMTPAQTIPQDFQQGIAHDILQTIPQSIPQVIPQSIPPEGSDPLDVPSELSIAQLENDSDSDFDAKMRRKPKNEGPVTTIMPSARPTRKAKENACEVALAVANNGKIPRKRLQPIVEQEMVPVIPQNPPSGINQSMAQTISQPMTPAQTIPQDFQQGIAHDILQTIPQSIPQVIPQSIPPEGSDPLDVPSELSIAQLENDSDSDFDAKMRRKPKNEGPAAKKRKGAGAGGQQSSKKGAAGASGFEEEPKDGSLFDIVRYGRVSLQISSVLWSKEHHEIVTGHGFKNNSLSFWKFPNLEFVGELKGHSARILNTSMSPDDTTVASLGADETIRLWKCFTATKKASLKPHGMFTGLR